MNKVIFRRLCYDMPRACWHYRLDGGLLTLKYIIYFIIVQLLLIFPFRILNLCQLALHGEKALFLHKRGNSSFFGGLSRH